MNRFEMKDHASEVFKQCLQTHEKAQKEYTLEAGDAFDNFKRTGADLALAQEKVLWIFFKKHLDGILNYINGHQVQRESIHGRIVDAINYLALLDGMIIEKEKNSLNKNQGVIYEQKNCNDLFSIPELARSLKKNV